MQTLNSLNEQLSFYRNSEYKWVRELTTSFEKYFDKEHRAFLEFANFTESQINAILSYLLDTLHRLLSINDFYWYDESTKALNDLLYKFIHPSYQKDLTYNKERVEGLFNLVTMPFLLYEVNISNNLQKYYKLKLDTDKLNELNRQSEIREEKLQSNIAIYQKALEIKNEAARKSINKMAQSYIETCESFNTYKPTNPMLEKISSVEERFWKKQLANEIFLSFLLDELNKKCNQAKELKKKNFNKKAKKDFWSKAFDYIATRIDFKTDKDKFKRKYSYDVNVDYENRMAKSKGKRITAQEIIRSKQSPIEPQEEKSCNICGNPIEVGNLCKDCYQDMEESN